MREDWGEERAARVPSSRRPPRALFLPFLASAEERGFGQRNIAWKGDTGTVLFKRNATDFCKISQETIIVGNILKEGNIE